MVILSRLLLSLRIPGKYEVLRLHDGMTLIALPYKSCVFSIRCICGGLCIKDETRISPAAGIGEPLRVLHDKLDPFENIRLKGGREVGAFLSDQPIFTTIAPSGKGLPLPGIPS